MNAVKGRVVKKQKFTLVFFSKNCLILPIFINIEMTHTHTTFVIVFSDILDFRSMRSSPFLVLDPSE